MVWLIPFALSGILIYFWQSWRTEKNLKIAIGKEIAANLDHIIQKLQIWEKKPMIYVEPEDPNDRAIDRFHRAKNVAFETKTYDASLSVLSQFESAPDITDFYKELSITAEYEAGTIAVSEAERRAERTGLMHAYAWQRLPALENLYKGVFAYGSELLDTRLDLTSPLPPADFATEINQLRAIARMEGKRLKRNSVEILRVRLIDYGSAVEKMEEYKSRLPGYEK